MTGKEAKEAVLRCLDLADRKAEEEELATLGREELNVWIPEGTSGESLVADLAEVRRCLTEENALRMLDDLDIQGPEDGTGTVDEDMSAEECAQNVIQAFPRDAEAYLQTVG